MTEAAREVLLGIYICCDSAVLTCGGSCQFKVPAGHLMKQNGYQGSNIME